MIQLRTFTRTAIELAEIVDTKNYQVAKPADLGRSFMSARCIET
jgi:hypothetical protein